MIHLAFGRKRSGFPLAGPTLRIPSLPVPRVHFFFASKSSVTLTRYIQIAIQTILYAQRLCSLSRCAQIPSLSSPYPSSDRNTTKVRAACTRQFFRSVFLPGCLFDELPRRNWLGREDCGGHKGANLWPCWDEFDLPGACCGLSREWTEGSGVSTRREEVDELPAVAGTVRRSLRSWLRMWDLRLLCHLNLAAQVVQVYGVWLVCVPSCSENDHGPARKGVRWTRTISEWSVQNACRCLWLTVVRMVIVHLLYLAGAPFIRALEITDAAVNDDYRWRRIGVWSTHLMRV